MKAIDTKKMFEEAREAYIKQLALLEDKYNQALSKIEHKKEPLIKDEKIRKAVRAWAEAIRINGCRYDEFWRSFRFDNCTICFKGKYVFEGLEDEKYYTIAELCGEEEECES